MSPCASILELKDVIQKICLKLGVKAVYDTVDGTTTNDHGADVVVKWRIPLSAYQESLEYLRTFENVRLYAIPKYQLEIASNERNRQKKSCPSVDVLVQYGIPEGLAKALTPFQRIGVDFVRDKNGRAWIADGKYHIACISRHATLLTHLSILLACTRHGVGKNHTGGGEYGNVSCRMAASSYMPQWCPIPLEERISKMAGSGQ